MINNVRSPLFFREMVEVDRQIREAAALISHGHCPIFHSLSTNYLHFLKSSFAASNQYGRSSLKNFINFSSFFVNFINVVFFSSAELPLQKHLSLLKTCLKCIASCLISIVIMFSLWELNKRWVRLSFLNQLKPSSLYRAVRFANFEGILGFSVPSIILTDLLGNTCLPARVQKVMVCDSWLVDFDPFCLFRVSRFVALWSSCFGQ